MWRLKQKRVIIPAVVVLVMIVAIVGLSVLGRNSTVPAEERVDVRPSATPSAGPVPTKKGSDPQTSNVTSLVPLPQTDDPAEMAANVTRMLGSTDAERFEQDDYARVLAEVSPSDAPGIPQAQWADATTMLALSWEPWEERQKLGVADEFEPTRTKVASDDGYVQERFFGGEEPSSEEQKKLAKWLEGQETTVVTVQGNLQRQATAKDGSRRQWDEGPVEWVVVLSCEKGARTCTVLSVEMTGKVKSNGNG